MVEIDIGSRVWIPDLFDEFDTVKIYDEETSVVWVVKEEGRGV